MGMTVVLKPCKNSPVYKKAVVYDATSDIWYLYDTLNKMYVLIDRKETRFPNVTIWKSENAEYFMKIKFKNGHKFYYADCDTEGVNFAPTNVKLVDETMNGRKTIARKPSVRKPAARKPTRK